MLCLDSIFLTSGFFSSFEIVLFALKRYIAKENLTTPRLVWLCAAHRLQDGGQQSRLDVRDNFRFAKNLDALGFKGRVVFSLR